MIKRILKTVLLIALIPGLYIVGVLIYGSLNDWQPEKRTELALYHQTALESPTVEQSFELLIWNIGFGGLGEESDFFYDGGKAVHQPEATVVKNEEGILKTLKEIGVVDMYLFQEVDVHSSRSYKHNQYSLFQEYLAGYDHCLAYNYKVDFVPLPLTNPLGEINSGVATFSRFELDSAARYAYDTQFEWPRKVFFLDRCFLTTWVDLPGDKELLVINTHNTAYDVSGELSKGELQTLLDYAQPFAEEGHYIVVGGDWNRCPPSYQPIDPEGPYREHVLSNNSIPKGWKWIADINTPTNRKLTIPYDVDESYTSCIDHYLVSENVTVQSIETINTDFAYSDHQPVKLTFGLK